MNRIITILLIFYLLDPYSSKGQSVGTIRLENYNLNQLDSLQNAYSISGDYDKALNILQYLKSGLERKFGEGDSLFINASFNYARNLTFKGDYKLAEIEYDSLEKIIIKFRGKENIQYFFLLSSKISLYTAIEEYETAKTLVPVALELSDHIPIKTAYEYADFQNVIGLFLKRIGKIDEALKHYLKGKKLFELLGMKESLNYSVSLNNIAVIKNHLGKYEEALMMAQESMEVTQKIYGKNHIEYAKSLSTIGLIYYHLGNFEKSVNTYGRVIKIYENTGNTNNPSYTSIINNLGVLNIASG